MASINIRLNKNFTTAYNKMQEAYGEEIAKINGFSDGQLSYTDFIDNFVDSDTVADASAECPEVTGIALEADLGEPIDNGVKALFKERQDFSFTATVLGGSN